MENNSTRRAYNSGKDDLVFGKLDSAVVIFYGISKLEAKVMNTLRIEDKPVGIGNGLWD